MAATMAASKALCRLSSPLQQTLVLKLNNKRSLSLPSINFSTHSQVSASAIRISRTSRLPLELSSLETMMPLHCAIASARLRSMLAVESQSWGLIPQGISMPL